MSKPEIAWNGDEWSCCLDWSQSGSAWGFGETPAEAYADWIKNSGIGAVESSEVGL